MTLTTLLAASLLQMAFLVAAMSGAWVLQQRSGNSGWIDAVWTFSVGTVGAVSALLPLGDGGSPTDRQLLVAALVSAWALRLGSHIVARSAAKADDPRYAELIAGWGEAAPREMFFLLQKQALVSLPLTLSVLIAAHRPGPGLDAADYAAVAIALIAVAGEAVSDRQLKAWLATSPAKGTVCARGLWRYSRHPNYFFEWLHWLAYPAIAIDTSGAYPWGWLAFSAPLMMYWLLRHVSGVPPLEAHMVRKHGTAYRDYQQTTSAFFPWVPKHG